MESKDKNNDNTRFLFSKASWYLLLVVILKYPWKKGGLDVAL